ncbi:MAG TPA: FeoA domain-containing protein [Stellaceae bacterium]|jgi:ferrous iron transport protein A
MQLSIAMDGPVTAQAAEASPLQDAAAGAAVALGSCTRGWRGHVADFDSVAAAASGGGELVRRLLEIGFVEGASVEVMHEGPFGRDPIAVRIDGTATIALRRRDAAAIRVVPEGGRASGRYR